MAIKGNDTSESSGSGSQLYTGIAAYRVTAINPTQEELKAMGYKAEKAPVYTKVKDGILQTTIVFYVEATAPGGNKIKTNTACFIRNKILPDVFINKYGKYGKDRTKIPGELRNPYDGEIDLLKFIADWANVSMKKGQEEELYLDTIKQIAEHGDLNELREIMRARSGNVFKALSTVSEGKYQRIYNRRMARSWSDDYSFIHTSLVENQKYLDDIGEIDLKLYVPTQFTLKPWKGVGAALAAVVTTTGNGSHHPTPPPSGEEIDKPPF
jgi:hypothetical protein